MSASHALHEENKRGEMIGYLSAKEAGKIRNKERYDGEKWKM